MRPPESGSRVYLKTFSSLHKPTVRNALAGPFTKRIASTACCYRQKPVAERRPSVLRTGADLRRPLDTINASTVDLCMVLLGCIRRGLLPWLYTQILQGNPLYWRVVVLVAQCIPFRITRIARYPMAFLNVVERLKAHRLTSPSGRNLGFIRGLCSVVQSGAPYTGTS